MRTDNFIVVFTAITIKLAVVKYLDFHSPACFPSVPAQRTVDYLDQVCSFSQKLEDAIVDEGGVGAMKWINLFQLLVDWTHTWSR